MVYHLYARVLFVIEPAVETVAEDQHVHSLKFEVLKVIQLKVLGLTEAACHEQEEEE